MEPLEWAACIGLILMGGWAALTEVRIWVLKKRLGILHQWCRHAGEAIAELEDDS